MNLRQSKALVTKIRELLHRDQHKPQAARLAKEFLEICEATNKRLEQCVSMVENHNIVGAVQLANQSPPVMEMIKILSIDEASKWAQYCDNQNLPQAPVFDASSIRALTHALQNEDEIGPTHPLSREFTQLMMSRDFTGAYGVLQAILELDPSNQSANQARPEVEQGVLRTHAKKLNAALRDNDIDVVNRLVEEVEDMPFFEAKQLDCWPQAKACQVNQWLGQASTAIQAQDWRTSSELLDKVLQAQKQVAGLSLNQKQENFVREASEWTEQKESTWLKEEEYNDAVRQLDAFLQNRENDRARNVSHCVRPKVNWMSAGPDYRRSSRLFRANCRVGPSANGPAWRGTFSRWKKAMLASRSLSLLPAWPFVPSSSFASFPKTQARNSAPTTSPQSPSAVWVPSRDLLPASRCWT